MKLTCLEKEKKKEEEIPLDSGRRGAKPYMWDQLLWCFFWLHNSSERSMLDHRWIRCLKFCLLRFLKHTRAKVKEIFLLCFASFFFFFFAKTVCLRVILRFSLTSHIFLVMYQELYQKWVSCCKSYRMLKYECFFILRVLLTSQVLIYGNLI